MEYEQELRPAHNISPGKKCNSTDPAVYKQFLEEKSRQNALKRRQEELENRSAKAQREQGWSKYVNGENKSATRRSVPSISGASNPSSRRKSTLFQNQQNTQYTYASALSGVPVMPRSGPPPAYDSQKYPANKSIPQSGQQRRESAREPWGHSRCEDSLKPTDVGLLANDHLDRQQDSVAYMESLQPGIPFISQKQSDSALDSTTQESLFHGIGTMFEETHFSYDFEATGAGLEAHAIEEPHESGLKEAMDDRERLSNLESSTKSMHESSTSLFGSLLNTREGTDSSASMSIPDSLMILAEKIDQLPPSCFQTQESLAPNDSRLPPRSQDDAKDGSRDDSRPRSSFQELRQQAHDIKATFTKLSTNDPSAIADYVLNMPQEFQIKLMHLIRRGISGDQQSLGELHISFQQTSLLSEVGDSFVTPTSLCNKSLASTPTCEIRRVKEVATPSPRIDSTSALAHRANLPIFNGDLNLETYRSPSSASSRDISSPKQPFQPTPTPIFSKSLRGNELGSPDSPEEKPITSINQHSLQRATLRRASVSPPDTNAPAVDICVPILSPEELAVHDFGGNIQECFDQYTQRHSQIPSIDYTRSTSDCSIPDDTGSSEETEYNSPLDDVNRILRIEEALRDSSANRRFSAKPLLANSSRSFNAPDGKPPAVLESPLLAAEPQKPSRPQSHYTPCSSNATLRSSYGPYYLEKIQDVDHHLPIIIFKFTSSHSNLFTASVRTTMLPNILQDGNTIIYTAEYLSLNSGIWKTRQRKGEMCVIDAIPSQKDPVYIYLSSLYLPGTPKYSIAQETRRTREPALIMHQFTTSVYAFYLSAAENYCKKNIHAYVYEKIITDLRRLTSSGSRATVGNSPVLRKAVLDISSVIARDVNFRSATCIETHRCINSLPATTLGSATDVLIDPTPIPFTPTSKASSRGSSQHHRIRVDGSLITPSNKTDRAVLYDKITISILSNHGDIGFVGLSALQFYDSEGIEISPFYDAISGPDSATVAAYISTDPKKSSIIPAGSIYNLLNFECRTTDPDKMWVIRRNLAKQITITISIPVTRRVSAVRFWNYNKSPTTTDQGARRVLIKLNAATVADAEIKKATGTLSGCCLCATLIVLGHQSRDYVEKVLARDRYRDIIKEESQERDRLARLGEVPKVDFSAAAYNQRGARQSSHCKFGPLSTSTLSLMVTSMYGDHSNTLTLGNLLLIDQNNTALLPRKVQLHGQNATHVIRGHCMSDVERSAILVPEFNLEQSCYTGASTKHAAFSNEYSSEQERAVTDIVDEPLWVCSVEKPSNQGYANASSRIQDILATDCGIGITIWFKAAGTVAEDGSILSSNSPTTASRVLDEVDEEEGTEEPVRYIKNVIIINTAGNQYSNIRYVLLFVNGVLWTPFPGVFVRPNCYANYFATLTTSLKDLINKISLIVKARRQRREVEDALEVSANRKDHQKSTVPDDVFERLYKDVSEKEILNTPAFIEPQIANFIKIMHLSVLFGQWISLGINQPRGAMEITKEVGLHTDYDALFNSVHSELVRRVEKIQELQTGVGYGVGKQLAHDLIDNSMCSQSQIVYVSQQLSHNGQHLSYISLNAPRGYCLTINILSRYPAQKRPRSASSRQHPNGSLHTVFSIGFNSVRVYDGVHNPINFNAIGCGVYSTVLSQTLTYDLQAYRNVSSSIVVSDAESPASNLLKGLPWEVTYRLSLNSSTSSGISEEIEEAMRRMGISRSDGVLMGIHFISSSPMDISAIVFSNNKVAEVSIALDTRVIFEGCLKNTPDPQAVTLCKNQQQYKSVASVDINDKHVL